MLQDSKTKIDIIRMQLRRALQALQAGELESQAAPDEAQGKTLLGHWLPAFSLPGVHLQPTMPIPVYFWLFHSRFGLG
jgi:hypothetical protein